MKNSKKIVRNENSMENLTKAILKCDEEKAFNRMNHEYFFEDSTMQLLQLKTTLYHFYIYHQI